MRVQTGTTSYPPYEYSHVAWAVDGLVKARPFECSLRLCDGSVDCGCLYGRDASFSSGATSLSERYALLALPVLSWYSSVTAWNAGIESTK